MQKEEAASAVLVLTRPANGGAFAAPLSDLRAQADRVRPFEWKEVDDRIDTWFSEAVSRFPEEYKKHAANWPDLREQTKRDARVILAPLEQGWKDSVGKAANAFETSEAEFYASRPALKVRGTYHYFEGQRNRSGIDPSWQLANATCEGFRQIRGSDSCDSGEIVIKAAGMNIAMFSLRSVWDLSLEAAIDPNTLRATALGAVNTPSIKAWLCPRFNGKSNRKISSTWRNCDKSSSSFGPIKVSIGDSQISVSMDIGYGFVYEVLDEKLAMPVLKAGEDLAPLSD